MDTALFFHILGAILMFSGMAVAGVAFESGRRRTEPAEISLLLGLSRAGVVLVASGALLLLVCGFWLISLTDHSMSEGWLGTAFGCFLIATGLGSAAGRKPKEARLLATELAAEGKPATPELRALLDDPMSRWGNYAALGLMLVILALMVFRP